MNPSRPFRPWSIVVGALPCLVAAAAGFVCGWSSRPLAETRSAFATVARNRQPAVARPAEPQSFLSTVQTATPANLRSLAGVRERAGQLQLAARTHADRAMAEALGEPNFVIRTMLRNAVLQGWAGTSPEDAAAWVLRLPKAERANAMAAVFSGAIEHPEQAVELGTKLRRSETEDAATYGQLLVRTLDDSGAFETALQFARQVSDANTGTWINTVFADWSTFDPGAAAAAIAKLSEATAREAAFAGMTSGWSNANPEGLANYAAQLSPGPSRDSALNQALTHWALSDPGAALAWMNRHADVTDCDGGLSAVATQPDLVGLRPDVAIECAASIEQPELRTSLLRMLAETWAERDQGSATAFISRFATGNVDDRRALDDGLGVAIAAR